ncbi:Glutamine-binding periplasmic protein precursor [compost metagenome]
MVIGTEGSADARAQLRQSRIDAAMQGSETLSYLKTQEKDMYKTVGQPISVQFSGMGLSNKKPELSEAVKVALQSMIDDGSYQTILKKWDLELGAIKTATINAGK